MTIIVSVTPPAIATLDGQTVSSQYIIKRAIRSLGQLTKGKEPSDSEYDDGLEALNDLLDSLRNDRLMVYALQEEELTLTGVESYSIGPAGDLATNRPLRIEDAVVVLTDGSVCGVRVVEADEWACTNRINTADFPSVIHYEATLPNGTLSVAPSGGAGYSLRLVTRVPLVYFTALDTEVNLAPGWREMLVTNLAIALGPEYETEAPPSVARRAINSMASIKRVNSRPMIAVTELAALIGRRPENIISGQ